MINPIMIEIGAGELIDRITILEIKSNRIKDIAKLDYIVMELIDLDHCRIAHGLNYDIINRLKEELKLVNEKLWNIEEVLRFHEDNQDFDEAFIILARSVYKENDRRSELKRELNKLANSRVVEQKSF